MPLRTISNVIPARQLKPTAYPFAILLPLALLALASNVYADDAVQLTSAKCTASDSKIQGHIYTASPSDLLAGSSQETARWITTTLNRPNATMKPYLDIRYVNPVSRQSRFQNHLPYSGISSTGSEGGAWGTAASVEEAKGSLIQYKCSDGMLAAGGVINGFDSPKQSIDYGGPQGALTYLFAGGISTAPSPWNSSGSGNLMMQGYFSKPYRFSADGGRGADGGFNIFLRKKKGTPETINFVISTHRSYELTESEAPKVDPTTNAIHISTLVADDTVWVTKSPISRTATGMRDSKQGSESWSDFFRVNITYANMESVLQAAGKTSTPEEWAVTSASVLYEFTGSDRQAIGFSVRAFELFQSEEPF